MINIKQRIANMLKVEGYYPWKMKKSASDYGCQIFEKNIDEDHWRTCKVYNLREDCTNSHTGHTYTRHVLHYIFNTQTTGLFAPMSQIGGEFILYYTVFHNENGDNIINLNRGIIADYTKDKEFRPLLNNIRTKLIDSGLICCNDI